VTPTPPPIDLAGPLNTYRQGLNTALQRGMMAKELQKQKDLKALFADPKMMSGIPTAIQPFIRNVGAADPSAGLSMAGNVIANQYKYRKPTYRNVEVRQQDGTFVPQVLSGTQIAGLQQQGVAVRPYNAPPHTVFNMSGKLGTTLGEKQIDAWSEAQETLSTAVGLKNDAQQLLGLLKEGGVETGFGQNMILEGQKFAKRLGLNEAADLSGAELFQAIATRMTLPLVKTLGVNPTDKDLDFVIQGQAELSKTKAGNIRLLNALVEKQRRVEARARLRMKFFEDNADLLETNPFEYTKKFSRKLRALESSFAQPRPTSSAGPTRRQRIGAFFSGNKNSGASQ